MLAVLIRAHLRSTYKGVREAADNLGRNAEVIFFVCTAKIADQVPNGEQLRPPVLCRFCCPFDIPKKVNRLRNAAMRATFLLDIQSKNPAGDPLVFAFTQSKPGPRRILSITALTQQKLCYFVAFAR